MCYIEKASKKVMYAKHLIVKHVYVLEHLDALEDKRM